MKIYVKYAAVIICFLFIACTCGITDASSIKESINNEKILLIVKDVEEMNDLDLSEFEGYYDIVQEKNIDYDLLDTYSSFGVGIELLKSDKRLKKILVNKFYKENSEVYV